MLPRPPSSTLFPYTTLFRSHGATVAALAPGAPAPAGGLVVDLTALSPPPGVSAAGVVGQFEFLRRSEEHTSELQSLRHLVCRLLLEKKKKTNTRSTTSQH